MKKNVKTLRLYDFSRFRSLKSSHKYRLSSKLLKKQMPIWVSAFLLLMRRIKPISILPKHIQWNILPTLLRLLPHGSQKQETILRRKPIFGTFQRGSCFFHGLHGANAIFPGWTAELCLKKPDQIPHIRKPTANADVQNFALGCGD